MSDPRSINTNSLQIVQIGIYGNEEFKFLIAIQVATSFDPMFHLEFLSTFLFLFFLFFLFLFFFCMLMRRGSRIYIYLLIRIFGIRSID